MSELKIRHKYKFIHFKVIDPMPGRKTVKIGIFSNTEPPGLLSIIKWYPSWRKYCLFYEPDLISNPIVMDMSCLNDIGEFLNNLNIWHKMKGKK